MDARMYLTISSIIAILYAIGQPENVAVNEILVRPRAQAG